MAPDGKIFFFAPDGKIFLPLMPLMAIFAPDGKAILFCP